MNLPEWGVYAVLQQPNIPLSAPPLISPEASPQKERRVRDTPPHRTQGHRGLLCCFLVRDHYLNLARDPR